MLNGLDLFSGIGGITFALSEWVKPIAYCEQDRYAQGVLLSRMASGDIRKAPIWDDVRTLHRRALPCEVDIIYGGFPCQDISVAGHGEGLAGERSGLFFEIVRLAQEIKPSFIFLENVPAIRTRGLDRVIQELTQVGYDCRWTMLSAADVGANHKRERWFLLAHTCRMEQPARTQEQGILRALSEDGRKHDHTNGSGETRTENLANSQSEQSGRLQLGGIQSDAGTNGVVSDTKRSGLEGKVQPTEQLAELCGDEVGWWAVEPNVGRVVDGVPNRVDRLKGLGNAVVPLQAKTAFEILMGLK